MNVEQERAAIEDAYRAIEALAPLVERLNALEEEEARTSRLLEQFATVVERRLLCSRCGARIPAAVTHCVHCGAPLRRRVRHARSGQP